MHLSFARFFAGTTAFFVLFAAAASGQLPNFNRTSNYDVQHYTIRVKFDHRARTVFGDTTVELKPLADSFRTVELDARDLKFESVRLDGADSELKYRAAAGKVAVTLDRAYKTGETIKLRFRYSAKPKKGVYFVDERVKDGKVVHSAQIWTQGEPDEAHHWFPSFDHPSDKATTEQMITAEKGFEVIGNGERVSLTENADGTVTHHFRMTIPHTTYLVSFVIGKYEKFTDKYRDVSLTNYLYPGTGQLNTLAYGRTKDMLKAFEEMTGVDYPFNKYDQTVVANFAFGGMENITATTMADTEINYAQLDFLRGNVEDLVSHEIAHSWFGNNVTMRNWAELWLNEGFATFMEAAIRERLNGREDYIRKLSLNAEEAMADDAARKNAFGLFNRTAGDTSKLFDRPSITYSKGGVVVHMLREQVGDANFWKGVNLYLTRHRFGSVETPDLMRAMEEVSGQKLDWFFDQWVYGTSHPKLTVRQQYDDTAKALVFNIDQTQTGGPLVPKAFRLPLEIRVKFPDGTTRTETLNITDRKQTISIPTATKPSEVTFDPAFKLPLIELKTMK